MDSRRVVIVEHLPLTTEPPDLIHYNRERWQALVEAGIEFSRPFLNLDESSARQVVDPHNILGDVAGKAVLCLASGGGQQSAAFGLLGADVTVFDVTPGMLDQDRLAAAHYGFNIETVQGDMRDLSALADNSFDVVWHAFSITFVPDVRPVLAEVERVLRPGGFYRIEWANPFVSPLDEADWTGDAYPLRHVYEDAELVLHDTRWDVWDEHGAMAKVEGPREFRHTMSTMVNTLIRRHMVILGLWEELGDPDAEPGTWKHLKAIAPPWLTIWARYLPGIHEDTVATAQVS